ncbi:MULTISPECIES: metallophosphoesterase [Bacillota]|uniref:metallophosphoesterase n=1 Tax=Bacillota TaxID=1239 RepID=UPI00205921A9|nr:metallophosphoesterase [Veillonella sp.]MDU1127869.1 metallophosphoesterase [Veillonella sp.]DAH72299.1 MAG TPA: Protein phosphatase 2, regulatory subunit repeat, HYDROLASE-HYDROLASE INHIBITOR COMPLEX.8A [Caudoviricetes sp.]
MDWIEIRDMLGINITPDQLRKQAVGYEEYDDYIHGFFAVGTRILSISDAHVPFNLPIDIFKPYSNKVDILVFNGDTEDCWSCSSFPKRYRIGLDEEMVLTRQYMIDIINMIQPKKVVILMGNHEYRLGRYLTDKLNDDVLTIMPDTPLELIVNRGFHVKDRRNKTETWYSPISEVFDEDNIDVQYTGDWFTMVGRTIFAHPLSYSSGMLKTTEKAVNFFLRENREFNSICLGHTHKLGSYVQGGIKMYEQGCTCDLTKLDYNNGKLILPGQNGYIYICQDLNGDIIDDKTKLVTL